MRESELFKSIDDILERNGITREGTTAAILQLFHDRAVPPEYLEECDCATYTASIRDMVFQHKPACPKHDPRCELALLADHRHQAVMKGIRELATGERSDIQVDLFSDEAKDRQQAIGQKLAAVEEGVDRG